MKVSNFRRKLAAALAAGGLAVGGADAARAAAVFVGDSGFEAHVIDDPSGYAYGAASPPNTIGDPDGFNNPSSSGGGVSPWQALASVGNGVGGDNASWIFNSAYGAVNSGNQAAEVQGVFAQNLTATFTAGQKYIATVAAAASGGDENIVVSLYDAGAVTFSPTSTPDVILNEPSLVTATPVITSDPYSDEMFTFSAASVAGLAGKNIGIAVYAPDATGQGPWIDDIRLESEVGQLPLELTIDRADGSLTLSNSTGGPINISGYQLTSPFEDLDPANWVSIADNYDGDSGGTVDGVNSWTRLTQIDGHGDLSEADLETGNGGSLADNESINLGNAGTWIRNPNEDVVLQYVSDGGIVTGAVKFENGEPFVLGDVDTDGDIDSTDWGIVRSNQHTDLSAESLAEAYRLGDLTGDLKNDHADFRAFKIAFDGANGPGAFTAMITAVPEPSSLLLLVAGVLLVAPNELFAVPALRRRPLRN